MTSAAPLIVRERPFRFSIRDPHGGLSYRLSRRPRGARLLSNNWLSLLLWISRASGQLLVTVELEQACGCSLKFSTVLWTYICFVGYALYYFSERDFVFNFRVQFMLRFSFLFCFLCVFLTNCENISLNCSIQFLPKVNRHNFGYVLKKHYFAIHS